MAEDLLGLGKVTEAVTTQLTELLKPLLGPLTQELGQLFSDPVRNYRIKQTLKRVQEMRKLLAASGIQPKTVPLKTLYPILEGCFLEEDNSDLVSKWVGLLASAATGNPVHPSYPKILAELTPVEAKILDVMHDRLTQYSGNELKAFFTMREIYSELGLSLEQFEIALINLARLALYNGPFETGGLAMLMVTSEVMAMPMKLTPLGENFVKVCRGPQLPAARQ